MSILGAPWRGARRILAFARALAADPRVPLRDRAVIAGMLAYLASPLDLIPDFIPVLGYLDDGIVLILLLDYVFNHLDRTLLDEHWPWSEQARRRTASLVSCAAWLTPRALRRRLWQAPVMPQNTPGNPAGKA